MERWRLSPGKEATLLRLNSPFGNVLSRTENERALESFRRHRKQAHGR